MSKIVKASEPIQATAIKVLLYGEPGIGKTTFALSAPRPLLIDCDGGVRRVSPQFRRDYVPVASWDDIMETIGSNLDEYDTFVIDTVGRALDFLSESIIKGNYKLGTSGGGLTLQGWGVLGSQFKCLLSAMNASGKHLIFIAHQKEGVEDEKRYYRPEISGQTLGNIIRDMDLVGYMQSRNNKRTISFNPADTFYGKNACELPPVIELQDLNKKPGEKPLTAIFEHYYASLEKQGEVIQEYEKLLEKHKKAIGKIKNVDQANEMIPVLKEAQVIWDSPTILKIELSNKCKELGFKYDREMEAYYEPPVEAK